MSEVTAFERASLDFVDLKSSDAVLGLLLRLSHRSPQPILLAWHDDNHRDLADLISQQFDGRVASCACTPGALSTRPDAEIVVLLSTDTEEISRVLHSFVDRPATIVTPALTAGAPRLNGLVVNTIAKSGTHLLGGLLDLFGIHHDGGGVRGTGPTTWRELPGGPHVSAQKFFTLAVNEPYGGYYNTLFSTPMLFLYRNPLAVLVSTARYLGEERNNAINHLMSQWTLDRRIDELIESELFGKFARSIDAYSSWLELPNVIPISFEELVGASGNGDALAQLRLIWSLQLKLRIAGSPRDFSDRLVGLESPTYRVGKIDSFRAHLLERHIEALKQHRRPFMSLFGYDFDDDVSPGYAPRHVDRFRHRRLILAPRPPAELDAQPLFLASHRGFNLILFRKHIYALHQSLGEVDISVGSFVLRERYPSHLFFITADQDEAIARIDHLAAP